MRTAGHLVGLVVVVLALPTLAAASLPPTGVVHVAAPPGTPPVRHGAALYAANCLSCHGDRGRGVTAFGPTRGAGDLRGQGPPLRGVGALAPDFYLRTGYMPLSGPGVQPRRSRVLFSDREIRGLVAYVASLGRGPAVPRPHPERGRVSLGLELFTNHCAGCHQVVAKGGYLTGSVAPPLDSTTPVQVAEAVRIGPYVMPSFSKKQITDAELDSIIAYVQYAKHPDDRGGWAIGHVGPWPEGAVTWLIAAAVLVAVCVVIGERARS